MHVAIIRLYLRLPSCTLKEKRAIVKSVVERLRNRFNASVAEIGELDSVGASIIGAAAVSNSSRLAESQARAIAAAVEEWRLDAEVVEVEIEVMQV
jgi:uncharacterized protein YlxP (DUF503 family)